MAASLRQSQAPGEPLDGPPRSPVDAFILFNEGEEAVTGIVEFLSTQDISTYFWRRDIEIGEAWREVEELRLRDAGCVVVFLGARGWGPNHLRLAVEAHELRKRLVPVVIGAPPKLALGEAGGIFETLRYLELQDPTPAALTKLVEAIRPVRTNTGRTDAIIRALVDGSEEERANVLRQIRNGDGFDARALSSRLRDEIRGRFHPTAENRFAVAVRDPKRIASIRSWMLSSLIWTDAEDSQNRDLILEHLQLSTESDRMVRFWALAGLQQVGASYLHRAADLCMNDPELEAASLALAIIEPEIPIEHFRKMLQSDEFDVAWAALRVLRIVPIPDLAEDLCGQLDRSTNGVALDYDVLYALADPAMMMHAAPILAKRPGLEALAATMVDIASESDPNAVRQFAVVLAGFEIADIERVLSAFATARPDALDIVRLLKRSVRDYLRVASAPEPFVAGFASDLIDVNRDDLDIREDVQTLTSVMLAKEVSPPLAIGLFGDWGSGKSFFMQSMKATAQRIADRARTRQNSVFCSEIVSVDFNAWHYSDTNLWASLVGHILEVLAAHVTPRLTHQEQEAVLLKDLESAKSLVSQIEGEKQHAQQQIDTRRAELHRIQSEREQKQQELRSLRGSELIEVLASDPELRKTLDDALAAAGMPACWRQSKTEPPRRRQNEPPVNTVSPMAARPRSRQCRLSVTSADTSEMAQFGVGGNRRLFIEPARFTQRHPVPPALPVAAGLN